ncbi:MAG: type IV pilus secretin PilQ [Candidatus Acidiferrales bacterium]
MRIMRRACGLSALLAVSLVLTNGALSANDSPVVHVKAVVKDGAVRLEAQANGPFEYTSYRPSESLYVLDLSGVSAADPAGARVVASDLIKSYRMLTYASGQKPIVRLEILLSQGVEPRLERKGSQDLTLVAARAATSPAPAAPSASSNPPALTPASAKSTDSKSVGATFESIRQVKLAQNGEQTEVNVIGSGKLSYHVSRLQNPDRLVLDFAGSHLKTTEKNIASNLDPVREIRLAQFTPEVSRIVIDLRTPARYNVNAAGNSVTIVFARNAAPAGGPVKTIPADEPSNLTTAKSQIPASAPAPSAPVAASVIPAPVAVLPVALTQSNAQLAAPAIEKDETATAPKTTTDSPAASAPAAAPAPAPVPAPAPESPRALINGQSPAPAPSGKYSGEPISVNLKDVDLRDFFRLIHEISGLNVVVDPMVKGNLTIVLDDVPWDQALDIVLKNNDLDKQLDGNVLRVATRDTLKKEAEETRDLAKAQAEAADVVTTTRVLSYGKATAMVIILKKFLTSRGDVLADARSNTLIIRDVPSVLPVLDNLIRQLDRKSQQVEIEARVVAATRSFSSEIGTQFGAASAFNGIGSVVSGTAGVGTSPVIRNFPPLPAPPVVVGTGGTTTTSGSIPLNTNLGVASPTSGISYSFAAKNFALDFIITAAENRGVGKLLSKPKVITQNNEKATVKQGTKIPVQTVVNNTVSVQFVDAVLQLEVTPQITAEGTIFMDVNVTNDQIDQSIPRVQGIPAIDTQAAETKVLINDGGTVVIGGIIVSNQQTSVDQVPLFGSLPVVGNLFKHTTVSSTAQELLFFLTPRILPS